MSGKFVYYHGDPSDPQNCGAVVTYRPASTADDVWVERVAVCKVHGDLVVGAGIWQQVVAE